MSSFGPPLPTPVSESTAIEIQRREGSARSWTIGTEAGAAGNKISAGSLVKLNSSGLLKTIGTEDPLDIWGVTLFQGTSGQPTTVIKGRVRAFWDGVGTVVPGTGIGASTTYSGWITATVSGPDYTIGFYAPFYGGGSLGASNSGTLVPVELF